MVNKFLYPNGGSETYIFKLGDYLKSQGHEVEYFGMEHEGRCVGNSVNAYTSDMDFHGGSKLAKLTYPIKTIYSKEARKKIRLVLDDFKPDVVHLNNFNYQLTPSVILEVVKWRKKNNKKCRIVYTAHDYQLVCPNHMMNNPNTHKNCEKCVGGKFINCLKGKCVHGSAAKSAVGMAESYFWNMIGVYGYIDKIICVSNFEKAIYDLNPLFKLKTLTLHNFTDKSHREYFAKKNYILYFGRYSEEKGIKTLIDVVKKMPECNFVFAGTGPMSDNLFEIGNIDNVGFKNDEDLVRLIGEARLCIVPSEWYEPFGLTVIESISCGTPVLGANIGGIPELIEVGKTGELFESGNAVDLEEKLLKMLKKSDEYSENCKDIKFNAISEYYERLMEIYNEK